MPQDQSPEPPQAQRVSIVTKPFAGFAVESAVEGELVRVQQRCAITSDDPRFYLYINQLDGDFLTKAGVNGDSTSNFSVVQRPDGSADVYTRYSASVRVEATRELAAGEEVYEKDINISTIDEFRPANLTLQKDDAFICVMKVGWKFGLYFDLTRDIEAERVWHELGLLYRSLQIDRVLANILEKVRLADQPHIMTEGKTDWRHIEAARRRLGLDLSLGYATDEDVMGDTALLQLCERMAKFGPPNPRKVIAIFDRDNPKVLKSLEERGDLNTFQRWGNNIYSLVLPTPQHRQGYKNVSIEMLYTDADLRTADGDGKRLFFDSECLMQRVPGSPTRYLEIPPIAAVEFDKKVFDGLAESIVDNDGRPVGLSKARFAELVHGDVGQFGQLDVSAFAPVFRTIKDILIDR
jgi:hypothetical protein